MRLGCHKDADMLIWETSIMSDLSQDLSHGRRPMYESGYPYSDLDIVFALQQDVIWVRHPLPFWNQGSPPLS